MTLTIDLASDDDAAAWDDYVLANPLASFFHRYGWARLIRAAYGYASVYLVARQGGDIVGVLPLIFVNSPLTGKALISTAFTVGGGIVADDGETANALAAAALARGKALGVNYVELRSDTGSVAPAGGDLWHARAGLHAGFTLSIPPQGTDILTAIPRKRRAEIRKSLGLAGDGALTICEKPEVSRFLQLYRASLHALGTPVFPARYLEALVVQFGDDIGFTTILHGQKPVVSLLSFFHRDQVLPYYVGAVREARALRAFDLVYWHQLHRAQENGLAIFDFGRSKIDSGSFGYKKTWGLTPTPLTYCYGLVRAATVPQINVINPKYALASRVWRHLPLPIATMGGAILARHFA
ncbi:MAG: FemAB family XrtA/PEP-CTERM system-associated protein [Pseudomonadota bacterium]